MVITSKSNPIIKETAKLHEKKFRREYGLYLVEGTKTVDECVRSGQEITRLICTEKLLPKYPSATAVSEEVFSCISSEKSPQGVIAVVKIPKNEPKAPQNRCILLDRLQDPGNLGTIIRTANAAGFEEIYLLNCTDAYSPKAVRASMSGIFFTKIYCVTDDNLWEVLEGVPLVSADMDGKNIFDFVPPEKFCLCIGSEGSGLNEEIIKKSAFKVSIPMRETCESLNAAVSAGIAMYLLSKH